MSIGAMWRGNAVTLFILIILNLAVMSLGDAAWIALGVLGLLVAGFMGYRQGMAAGHDACGVLDTVHTLREDDPGFGQNKADRKYLSQAWSASNGLKAMLISALIPYAAGCAYILCTLLNVEGAVLPTRVIAWVLNLPWWCLAVHWQSSFEKLTPLAAAILMITPFLLPLAQYLGYLQGPRLWARTEDAMKQGRRRAKARSRVAKKRVAKPQKPEV